MEENTLVIEDLGDDRVKITGSHGKIADIRTHRKYRVAIVKPELVKYFEAV